MTLTIVSSVGITGSYFGIWASVIQAFSAESLSQSIDTAAYINEYDQARHPTLGGLLGPSIRTFQETALLSEQQKETIREIMDETYRRMIAIGILLLLFIGWGSIFLTHKIAGPIFKLKQYFQTLKEGNVATRIQFRKLDEVHYLAEGFNEMASSLDQRISNLKRMVREAPENEVSDELRKELAKFKTSAD